MKSPVAQRQTVCTPPPCMNNVNVGTTINSCECGTQANISLGCRCDEYVECLTCNETPAKNLPNSPKAEETSNVELQKIRQNLDQVVQTLKDIQRTLANHQQQLDKHEQLIEECCKNRQSVSTDKTRCACIPVNQQNYQVCLETQTTPCVLPDKEVDEVSTNNCKFTNYGKLSPGVLNYLQKYNLLQWPVPMQTLPLPPELPFSCSKKFDRNSKSVELKNTMLSNSMDTVVTLNRVAEMKKNLGSRVGDRGEGSKKRDGSSVGSGKSSKSSNKNGSENK